MTAQNPEMTVAEENRQNEAIADELIETQSTYSEIIETAISSLDTEDTAMVNRSEESTLWKFQYGSVEVFVQITGETDDDMLTVWATFLKLPVKKENELMRKLLEMNWDSTYETCFAIVNDQVIVTCQRTVAELSPGEISRAITLVASIADDNDEDFKATYGASSSVISNQ
ncbi:MAG: YbjN domain-containing protein [Jaaginema sp. PMC 1079.18]|nr:YbjN domain-containing protein [Jaaginema sp. PMC 1080.18]MEC4850315.1 YbjN domain-containing protein [Jaaginema sp. PMC 1079.18]MEC4869051.1 YbjN domain-containing protein [Jaaginema sp. PMC 1078.18]